MQIYLSINDEKAGPFTLFQVEEKLRAGEIGGDTLGWYEGQEKWTPMQDLPPFEGFFLRQEHEVAEKQRRARHEAMRAAAEAERPVGQTHPWRRFFARNLDIFFVLSSSLLVVQGLRNTGLARIGYADFLEQFSLFLFPPWHVLEAVMISKWGWTPGKRLLGIRVLDCNGELLAINESLRRSFGVFVVGLGLLLPIITLVAVMFAYYTLQKRGRTFWDASVNASVTHETLQPRHVFLSLAVVLLLFSILYGPWKEFADRQMEVLFQGLFDKGQISVQYVLPSR